MYRAGFPIWNQVCWKSCKMCLHIEYFADIPVFPEVKNIFICTEELKQKFKKSGQYIAFYTFWRIPKHSLFLF